MLLFYELQKLELFSHDSYVKGLITTGEMSDQTPILALIKSREESTAKVLIFILPNGDLAIFFYVFLRDNYFVF